MYKIHEWTYEILDRFGYQVWFIWQVFWRYLQVLIEEERGISLYAHNELLLDFFFPHCEK